MTKGWFIQRFTRAVRWRPEKGPCVAGRWRQVGPGSGDVEVRCAVAAVTSRPLRASRPVRQMTGRGHAPRVEGS